MIPDTSTSAEKRAFMFHSQNHLPLIIVEIGDQTGRTLWVPVSPCSGFKSHSPVVVGCVLLLVGEAAN